jgi:GDPmannose 4,6-dehydratase
MWLMLQQKEPGDYVVATGISHSVNDLIKVAFGHVELDWEEYVVSDPKLFRPAEVDFLLGDPRKAKSKLEWQPKVTFEELIRMMIEADLQIYQRNPLQINR